MFELIEESSNTFELEESYAPSAKIRVVGVGGAGGNAVNRMIEAGVQGVEFIAMNTDMQALSKNQARIKLQLGEQLTGGKGAGADPEIGRQAALESEDEIADILRGSDMVFIAAGMGKGTGTGAAPVVAEIAHRLGILTIPVVTKPFSMEGEHRLQIAQRGLDSLKAAVDSVLVIPNDRIMSLAGRVPIKNAFRQVDDTLRHAIQSISDVVAMDGEMNCDFNDVKTIMNELGGTYMGVGAADGENAAEQAARMAMSNPYLENAAVKGAHGILINISVRDEDHFCADDLNDVLNTVRVEAARKANIIHGLAFNDRQDEDVRVTIIATGYEHPQEEIQEENKGSMKNGDLPTLKEFKDKKMDGVQKGMRLFSVAEVTPSNMDDMEIPAFMRRRHQRDLDRQLFAPEE